jgi:CheY-like chemotaxis protein
MVPESMNDSVKIHILIAEDDSATSRALSLVLGPAGARVSTVSDGEEALAFIEQRLDGPDNVDFLLFDVFMPGMGGVELIDALVERGISLPALAITGHRTEATRRALESRGYGDFLEKPFDRDEILGAIARMLKERD